MGVALQCPECGFKHRLDAVGDRDVFACAQCGRELKVPAAYRADTPAPNGNGGRPGRAAGRSPARPQPKRQVGATQMRLPVRILLWVVAFVLGALIVRFLAKATGFAGGDTFFDLLVDGSVGTYVRLLALVPVWALFATILATAFIDGPRVWARRRAGVASSGANAVSRGPGRVRVPPTAAAGAAGAGAAGAASAKRPSRTIPRREPAPVATPGPRAPSSPARLPDPPPVSPAVTRTAAMPAAAADIDIDLNAEEPVSEFSARAAAGQRPRRIPRRGEAS
jgi:hypothetical protein